MSTTCVNCKGKFKTDFLLNPFGDSDPTHIICNDCVETILKTVIQNINKQDSKIVCKSCHVQKEATEFYYQNKGSFLRKTICKKCISSREKAKREEIKRLAKLGEEREKENKTITVEAK